MANEYYSILTTVGIEKLTQAIITQIPVKITTIAVGDGNGQYYIPTPDQTGLKRETWRGDINDLRSSYDAENHILAEGVVPIDVGGWTVREVGLFDSFGTLIAIANYPETIKPLPLSGSGKQLYIQVHLVIDNIASISLTIDESVVLVSRAELSSDEAAKGIGYRVRGLWRRLSDFFAVEDFGDETDFTGDVKPESVTKVITNTVSSVLVRFGHVGISKKLFGSKTNGAVLSVRGTSGDPSFTPEVVNVSGSQGWANYNLADAVTFYSDIRIGNFEIWEVIDSPVYSIDGFTAVGLDFSKIVVGMTVRTRHETPCWAFITGVSVLLNKVYVDRWSVKNGTAGVIPAAGIGLYINPIDKAWAGNFNLIIPVDTRLSKNSGGVIAEFGLQNKGISTPVALNGLHVTLLNGSAYGGTAALNVTGFQDLRWVYGARISGVSTAMWSAGNSRAVVSAGDGEGHVFYGCVTFSDVIRNGSAVGEVLAARDGLGRTVRQPWVVNAANGNYAISAFGGATLHGTVLPGHIYYLPTLKNKGDHVPIYNPFFGSSLTIQTSDGENIHHPDGTISTSITVYGAQDITAVYLYDGWYLIGVNQNQTAVNGVLVISASSIPGGSVKWLSLSLPSATLGMMVAVSCSVDTGNLMITGRVSANGVVTVNLYNPTGSAINLPDCNFNIRVFYSS